MYCKTKKVTFDYIVFGLLTLGLYLQILLFTILLLYAILDKDTEGVIAVTAFFYILIVVFIYCHNRYRQAKTIRALNEYFMEDEDGLIYIADVAKAIHMKQKKFIQRFVSYTGKGYLIKCSIYPEDPTYIMLDNGKNTVKERFKVIHCPNCSGPNVIRRGFMSTCKYCNSELDSHE